MDLDPIYNPNIDPRYAKPKHLKPKDISQKKNYTATLEDVNQKLEILSERVEYLIQLLESNDKKFL